MTDFLKVLVVDDDRDGADGLADLVTVFGHESRTAYSGEAAVSVSEQEHFDLTFMDLHMPGMNGIEAYLSIRRTKPDAKVVFITGLDDEKLQQLSFRREVLDVIYKPVDLREILSAIQSTQA